MAAHTKSFIYTITNPFTGLVIYIGKTSNPKERFRKHRCQTNKTHICQAIKGIKRKGCLPNFEIIDECIGSEWKQKEIQYIKIFKALGAKLTNIMPGGEGGPTMKGRKLTSAQIDKIINSKIGRPNPATAKYNIANKGFNIIKTDLSGGYIDKYPSIREAAKSVNRNYRRIQAMVNNQKIRGRAVNHIGGFKFKKMEVA